MQLFLKLKLFMLEIQNKIMILNKSNKNGMSLEKLLLRKEISKLDLINYNKKKMKDQRNNNKNLKKKKINN